MEFLALKWAITDRFHEYLYGATFDVFTDNNPLTYILTTAKLDAMGQRWVASLGPYDFDPEDHIERLEGVFEKLAQGSWFWSDKKSSGQLTKLRTAGRFQSIKF